MENILPFLLAMAAIAFKIYDNFKKEQEKAQKRNAGAPSPEGDYHPEIPPVASKPVITREVKPQPVHVEEVPETRHQYEPTYKRDYKEPQPVIVAKEPRIEQTRAEILVIKEKINPEKPSEEVKRSRAIHQSHKHGFKTQEVEEEENPYAHFDLHDAVVKEAILNRPQF
jgi:hypothetical protein